MLEILENGDIRLTRGDTARLKFNLTNTVTKQPYEVQSDDVVTFTVKQDYESEEILIEKKSTGVAEAHIKPEDTKPLPFGKYKYDVQITTADGDNYTPIEKKTFHVDKEVG
jgi:hypothetical protein